MHFILLHVLAAYPPFPPVQVLRKGSGTLCEQLLVVEAFQKKIVCPNKHMLEPENFYKVRMGQLTYGSRAGEGIGDKVGMRGPHM